MATMSIPHRWKYDVFVSFGGEDIRKSFMDHMFNDFKQRRIHAFRDDTHLPKGEEVSPHLYKAIEESRFLIVIFSKNYASSSWRLRELVKILECKQMGEPKHEVQIIFYDVKPDVVRKQTRSYAEAFAKHDVSNSREVDKWREALSMAANLSGWDLQDMTNGYEFKFIDYISKEILKVISDGSLDVAENLVSVDARVLNLSDDIKITNWQRGELLGRGSFGSVYEGICDGGYFIAVKEVSLLDSGELGRQSIEQEIALLSQFEHENIVRYYGTDKDESKLYIFLELVTKGSLLSLYQRYHLQDCQVSSYTRQILHGLKYLHDRSVVHRDIKCANILVDANGSVKLADFGLAKATKFNDVRSCKGTPFWMAPEVVNQKNKGYGLAADIWSLGCTVLEMLTRQIPYSPMEWMAALFRIGRGIAPPVPDSLSKEARDFIFQCFHVNPRDRPTATQLLDHPFVRRPLPLGSHQVE